jgi:hypothetical protein
LKTKQSKQAKLAATSVVVNPTIPGPNTRSKSHCISHFANQLTVANGFVNGMPSDAGVRPCKVTPCTRIHLQVNPTPGTLAKPIADEFIRGTTNFGNTSFQSNFVRIIKFLSA